MTGSHPHNYENYPPPRDQPPPAGEPSDPPTGWTLAPSASPPTQPGPHGTGRRTVLGIGAAVGAGIVGLALLAGINGGEQAESGEATSWGDPDPEPDADEGEGEFDLSGLTVLAASGWEQGSSTEHRLVLRKGGNTVTFLHYEAEQDTSAMDEARQQLRRYAADVRRTKEVSATDESTGELDTAEVVLTGTVDGSAMDVLSSVVLVTEAYEAAAVVSVVLQSAATEVRLEATSMREDFLGQLG